VNFSQLEIRIDFGFDGCDLVFRLADREMFEGWMHSLVEEYNPTTAYEPKTINQYASLTGSAVQVRGKSLIAAKARPGFSVYDLELRSQTSGRAARSASRDLPRT